MRRATSSSQMAATTTVCVEVTPGGVQTTVPTTGLQQPYDLAVDAAGDVLIADPQNGRVVEVTPAGVQSTLPATGLNYPSGVTVDAAGDVFIGDQGAGQAFEINRSQPPSLNFALTAVSSTSTDSPQSDFPAKRRQPAADRHSRPDPGHELHRERQLHVRQRILADSGRILL